MTNESTGCPKCNAAMEAGFILDLGHYNAKTVSQWVEGAPERSIWTGIKTKDREKFQVTTYRCAGCGYLESYALLAQE
ncbi:MAG: PF20097 family protein [Blastocatellia bacterium]